MNGIDRLLRALGVLFIANNGRSFAMPGDAVFGITNVECVPEVAGGHYGGPGVQQFQADDFGFDFCGRGGGSHSGSARKERNLQSVTTCHPSHSTSRWRIVTDGSAENSLS